MENVRCPFPLRMLTSLLFITLSICQSGFVQAQDSDQSTSSPIGNTQFGVLNLNSPSSSLQIEVTEPDGAVVQPIRALYYEREAGDYEIRAKPSDDSEWSWKGTVSIQNRATLAYQIPNEAADHSIGWKIKMEQAHLASLKKDSEQSHAKQQIYKDLSKASFITGGLSALATGIVYFIGKSTMTSYINATDPTDAENLHAQLSNYSSMFFTYLSVSAVGLALGGILLATTPRPTKIDDQVQVGIEQLRKLEAEKAAKGQE